MKSIQIGNRRIVLAHITHFDFTPLDRTEGSAPKDSLPGHSTVVAIESPARLTIYLDNGKELNFSDEEAETGNRMLTSS